MDSSEPGLAQRLQEGRFHGLLVRRIQKQETCSQNPTHQPTKQTNKPKTKNPGPRRLRHAGAGREGGRHPLGP